MKRKNHISLAYVEKIEITEYEFGYLRNCNLHKLVFD